VLIEKFQKFPPLTPPILDREKWDTVTNIWNHNLQRDCVTSPQTEPADENEAKLFTASAGVKETEFCLVDRI